MQPFIVGIGGTLREGSLSLAALRGTMKIADAEGAETRLFDLRELRLPMYEPYRPIEEYAADAAPRINDYLDACRRAHAFVWSSPTYHGTISGVLKNAIDWIEALIDDPIPYLTGKAVGLISLPDALAQSAMANSVHELRAWLAPTRLTFNEECFAQDLSLLPDAPMRRATRLVRELIQFAKEHGAVG